MKNHTTTPFIKSLIIMLNLMVALASHAEVPAFDSDKPVTNFITTYNQSFNGAWDGATFNAQWDAVPNLFVASDITSGYLQFDFQGKRVLRSKNNCTIPYIFSSVIDLSFYSNRGGIIIRASATGDPEYLQETATGDPGFNREGIAFYPSFDGLKMIVQFTAADNGTATPVTRIEIPKPPGITNLRDDRGVIRIEDFGTSIYVYYREARYLRINLGGKIADKYTSGTVYNSDMQVVGTFENREVEAIGKVAFATRDAFLRLYSAEIKTEQINTAYFDSDKPARTFNTEYNQSFNTGWDSSMFFNQWDVMDPTVPFNATDVTSGFLQFEWIYKRVITSKNPFYPPYSIQTEIEYPTNSNYAGVIIRANPIKPDQVQEPAQGDPGFNAEGIAFYPNINGSNMIVQFTGVYNGNSTPLTKILVPKPAAVASLLNRGLLRIEDFGTSIYVYYGGIPLTRIELAGKVGSIYTSGTVYNSKMEVVGTFTGMEVEAIGKLSVAQRITSIKLHTVKIKYNALTKQTINFPAISKKQVTDVPFTISATATSGLPVEFSIISGPATVVGNIITLTGQPGIVTLSASQGGDLTYYPATDIIPNCPLEPQVEKSNSKQADFSQSFLIHALLFI